VAEEKRRHFCNGCLKPRRNITDLDVIPKEGRIWATDEPLIGSILISQPEGDAINHEQNVARETKRSANWAEPVDLEQTMDQRGTDHSKSLLMLTTN
jgi:hypothetical protein